MSNQSTWDRVQQNAATPGSRILTEWRAEREAARAGVSNDASQTQYTTEMVEAFGAVPNAAAGVAVNATSAMRVSAAAACVAKITGAIMSMPLHEYKHSGGVVPTRLPRSELWYMLNEQPCDDFIAASMWEGANAAQLLRGDGFALLRKSPTGRLKSIMPIPWGCCIPQRDPVTKQVRYYVNMPSHDIVTWFDPADILHFPGMGFDSVTMRSMSVIQAGARNAIGNAMAMDQYSGSFFSGGAHPSIILSATGKMDTDQITKLQVAFNNKYAGLRQAHQLPLVLTEGLTAKEISLSAEDAQLLEARKFQVLDIARAFGVPGFMINESTGSTSWGTGLETMSRGFVQYTLQPWLIKIEQELNRKLFPHNGGQFIRFYREAAMQGDLKAQADYYRLALGGPGSGDGWLSQDEVREESGRAPIPGGSEVFRAVRGNQSTEKAST